MRAEEQVLLELLDEIEKAKYNLFLKWDLESEFKEKLNQIIAEPFTKCTSEFLDNAVFANYARYNLRLWYLVAQYFQNNNDLNKQNTILLEIDKFCQKEHAENAKNRHDPFTNYAEKFKSGCALLPEKLANPVVIKNIYLANDEKLINTVKKYMPFPKFHVFHGMEVPEHIAAEERAFLKILNILVNEKQISLNKLEENSIKIQRWYRKKLRIREEINRITRIDRDILEQLSADPEEPITAEQLLQQANTPYIPQKCDPLTANRIVAAAKKIKLYSSIRHLTAKQALENIFNNGFYGRRNLLNWYLPFRNAGLHGCDVLNGDANAICFSPGEIDPKAVSEIEIVLDLKKVIETKPPAFYKVRDLEYDKDEIRTIPFAGSNFCFSPTKDLGLNLSHARKTPFTVYSSDLDDFDYYSKIAKTLMIAYDLRKMNQIYILNFFRFIDSMMTNSRYPSEATWFINDFYAKLKKMTDDELELFLKNAASELTKTAEFNFYGAYQMDFSSILTISDLEKKYTLDRASFIASLERGDLYTLKEARRTIPDLFKSYRFLDYLISKTSHPVTKKALEILRKSCTVPNFVNNSYYDSLILTEEEQNMFPPEPKVSTKLSFVTAFGTKKTVNSQNTKIQPEPVVVESGVKNSPSEHELTNNADLIPPQDTMTQTDEKNTEIIIEKEIIVTTEEPEITNDSLSEEDTNLTEQTKISFLPLQDVDQPISEKQPKIAKMNQHTNKAKINYNFYLSCLAAMTSAAGIALIIIGIAAMQPLLIFSGIIVSGAGLTSLGFFACNNKPATKVDESRPEPLLA